MSDLQVRHEDRQRCNRRVTKSRQCRDTLDQADEQDFIKRDLKSEKSCHSFFSPSSAEASYCVLQASTQSASTLQQEQSISGFNRTLRLTRPSLNYWRSDQRDCPHTSDQGRCIKTEP